MYAETSDSVIYGNGCCLDSEDYFEYRDEKVSDGVFGVEDKYYDDREVSSTLNSFYNDQEDGNSLFLEREYSQGVHDQGECCGNDIASYLSFYSSYSSVFPVSSSAYRRKDTSGDDDTEGQGEGSSFGYKISNLSNQPFKDILTCGGADGGGSLGSVCLGDKGSCNLDTGGRSGAADRFSTDRGVDSGHVHSDRVGSEKSPDDKLRSDRDEDCQFSPEGDDTQGGGHDPSLKEISYNLFVDTNTNSSVDRNLLVDILEELKQAMETSDVSRLDVSVGRQANTARRRSSEEGEESWRDRWSPSPV